MKRLRFSIVKFKSTNITIFNRSFVAAISNDLLPKQVGKEIEDKPVYGDW